MIWSFKPRRADESFACSARSAHAAHRAGDGARYECSRGELGDDGLGVVEYAGDAHGASRLVATKAALDRFFRAELGEARVLVERDARCLLKTGGYGAGAE